MHVYIFEGPDGAGKTTTINNLIDYRDSLGLSTRLIHNKYDPSINQVAYYILAMHNAYAAGVDLLIFDRAWYSEMVYGKTLRGKSDVSTADCMKLECAIRRYGYAKVFYVTAPLEILKMRCRTRGETFIKPDTDLPQLCAEYERVMQAAALPVTNVITAVI